MTLNSNFRSKIDQIRKYLYAGGFPNPLENAVQLSYFFYFNLIEKNDENLKSRDSKYQSIFEGKWKLKNSINSFDGKKEILCEKLRWSVWSNSLSGENLITFVRDEVFPFYELKSSSGFHNIFERSKLSIDEPVVLDQVLRFINELDLNDQDSDTKGDLFEYVIKKLKTSGELGQYRTPRHIIDFVTDYIDPKLGETIYDPAVGTAGFLVSALNYIKLVNSSSSGKSIVEIDDRKVKRGIGDKLSRSQFEILNQHTLYGHDVDADMRRLASMNLRLRDLEKVKILKENVLTHTFDNNYKNKYELPDEGFDIILANPPFSGEIDEDRIEEDVKVFNTKQTVILFIKYIINSLKMNGRCGVVVPDGFLSTNTKSHKEIRRLLIEENNLIAIVSLPAGAFQPYTPQKTSLIFFEKKNPSKEKVLFYNVNNDGYLLNANHDIPIDQNDLPEALEILKNKDKYIKKWNKEGLNEKYFFLEKKSFIENKYNLHLFNYHKEFIKRPNKGKSIKPIKIFNSEKNKLIEKIKKTNLEIFKKIDVNNKKKFIIFNQLIDNLAKNDLKILARDYLSIGQYPIIDQGQNQISGYTDDESKVIFEDTHLIVFGDHTRIFKLIKPPFSIGADGVKVFKIKDKYKNIRIEYLYYFLKQVFIPDTGYNRHFKFLKEIEIPILDEKTQIKIIEYFKTIESLKSSLNKITDNTDEIIHDIAYDLFYELY